MNVGFPDGRPLRTIGITLVIVGILSILAPAVAGSAVVMIIGILVLVVGAVQIMYGLGQTSAARKALPLILGGLTAAAGLALIARPYIGLGILSLVMAFFFLACGVWKMLVAIQSRAAAGWIWMFVSGTISLALGYMIWSQWPVSGLWAIGILIGVEFVLTGSAMLAIAATLKQVASSVR